MSVKCIYANKHSRNPKIVTVCPILLPGPAMKPVTIPRSFEQQVRYYCRLKCMHVVTIIMAHATYGRSSLHQWCTLSKGQPDFKMDNKTNETHANAP